MSEILIVEDNDLNRDMLSRRLCKRGFRTICVTNGQEAIDYLNSCSDLPFIILMDMRMPVMDGWTATKAIKTNPKTQHIPVIGLSANAMAHDRQRAIDAGCEDYDTKPVNFNNLLQIMARYHAA